MRKILFVSTVLLTFFTFHPSSYAVESGDYFDSALNTVGECLHSPETKNWFWISASIIYILMLVLKSCGVFSKIGKRWAYILIPVLSISIMLLSKFAGGLSWDAAFFVLTSGPAVSFLNDFVKRGVMAKEHKTPVKKQKSK